ncbi:MAG: phage tail protein [Sphingobacteriales bacterium]|nr:phage tail protein [Sphingobacteriales bacterium]MBI3716980.1 phage tail protein [Sphingobacteriales bacterium]
MADPFVAEIRIFPFNFPPKGWAFCDGQLLPLSQNTALFSLLGTTYGGDGRSNFALPNLQGSVPMHPGQGPGLSLHDLGEAGGSDAVTLIQTELPNHSHTMRANNSDGISPTPVSNVSAGPGADRDLFWYKDGAPNATMNPFASGTTGGNQPHNNLMPYLTMNFCIALQGVYPPRT